MSELKYIGDELTIFKDAINWKNYWFNSVKDYIKGDVLEVGAGIGVNTKLFLESNLDIKTLVAVEPDKSLASQITNEITVNRDKLTVHQGFLGDLDPSRKFDTIIYIDVIEHIEKDAAELELAKSHLNDDGRLIVLVPAFNFVYSPFDKAIGHFRRYNRKMLLTSAPSGLKQVKLFYLDSLGICASIINKIFLKQSYPTKDQILKWDRLIVPMSKITDVIFFHAFGKSLIGVWKK